MGSLKSIACAGLMAAGLVSGARAADLLPAPAPLPVPEPVAFGGWYLRGDIGFSNQEVDKLDNVLYDSSVVNIDKAFDAARERLGSNGRLVIRPSGTEPVIRVMAEGDDRDLVEQVVGDVCDALTRAAA